MAKKEKFRNTVVTALNTSTLPKHFSQYLREYHGINLNATPINPKDIWLKFRYTRNRTFRQINQHYSKLYERFSSSHASFKWEHEDLYCKWGVDFQVPFDLSALHSTDWNNPVNVIPALTKAYEQLPTSLDIHSMSEDVDQKERNIWVEELMNIAKEQNSTFVVIKTSYAPYPENMEQFNEYVRQRKECEIRMMCIGLEWLACSVDKLPEKLLEDIGKFGLTRKNCKVEFLVD